MPGVAYDLRAPALAPRLAWRAGMQVLTVTIVFSLPLYMSSVVALSQLIAAATVDLLVRLAQEACCACCARCTLRRCFKHCGLALSQIVYSNVLQAARDAAELGLALRALEVALQWDALKRPAAEGAWAGAQLLDRRNVSEAPLRCAWEYLLRMGAADGAQVQPRCLPTSHLHV